MGLAPPSLDNLTLGYIDETKGYVSGLSISDANAYERLNPNTTFIFRDGDGKVRYLSIEEVNALSTADLLRSDSCNTAPKPCGPPIVNIFGGGGIGAQGNAIVDSNGEIMAVDIVNGGYGYTSPPFAQVIDPCNIGSGAVLETEMVIDSNGNSTGRVRRILVIDSGRGYLQPPASSPQYPVLLQLKEVRVKNPGINYNCGVDKIDVCGVENNRQINLKNGTQLSYQCDPYGKIRSVDVINGGTYTQRPFICLESETGLNASFTPVFEVIRDPLFVEQEQDLRRVVQVYDLVGLSIQGYVDGRPYYGRVYFENDQKFAGVPGTGTPIPVYNTKVESINRSVSTTRGDSVRIVGVDEAVAQTTATVDIAPRTTETPTTQTQTTQTQTTQTQSTPSPSPSPSPGTSGGGGGGYGGY